MEKVFKVADIRKLERQVTSGEISYSRMVEIMNEMSNCAICKVKNLHLHNVINWVAAAEKSPDYDGDYLCFVYQVQECGEIWKLQMVITNQFNEWLIQDNETVVAWANLPQPPCL